MNTFAQIQGKLADKRVLAALGCCILGLNWFAGLDVAVLSLLGVVFAAASVETEFLMMIVFSVFDEVMTLEALGGSVMRVLMPVLCVKLVWFFIRHRTVRITKGDGILAAFYGVSFLVGIVTQGLHGTAVSILLNIGMVLLLRVYIRSNPALDRKLLLRGFVYAVWYAVLLGGAYGLVHLNFQISQIGPAEIARFNGVYEPNFMAVYLNFALALLLVFPELAGRRTRRVLMVAFCVLILLTVSMSGILLLFVICCVYSFYQKRGCLKRLGWCACVALISLAAFTLINFALPRVIGSENFVLGETMLHPGEGIDEPVLPTEEPDDVEELVEGNPLMIRVQEMLRDIREGNWAALTSGRTSLIREFWGASMARGTLERLLGNGPDAKPIFSRAFGKLKYAHNSYMDVLYCHGILGALLAAFLMLGKLCRGTFLSIEGADIRKRMRLVRLAGLFAGLTLSLYGNRLMFLIFLL